jgi:methylmalonyl-CoA mutase, N-terminal domain
VDPLAGSYFVEWLTNQVEERINRYLVKIDELGGMVSAIKKGYVQNEIAQSSFAYEMDLEEKRKVIVGMNVNVDPVEEYEEHACYQLDPALQRVQIRKLREFKDQRNRQKIADSLAAIKAVAARPEGNENNLMFPIKEAVKSYATLGEIFSALKEVFGEYQPP